MAMSSKAKKNSKQHKKLTKQEIKKYYEGFQWFDLDQDGAITSEELGNVMRSLGLNPTISELNKIVAEVDKNDNGKIEFEEFLLIMEEGKNGSFDTEIEMRRLFRVFDKDGDGFISANELRMVMTSIGEKLTEEEVKEMMEEADADGDGQINYEEFIKMMCI